MNSIKMMALALEALAVLYAGANDIVFVGSNSNGQSGLLRATDWDPQVAPNSDVATGLTFALKNGKTMRSLNSGTFTFKGQSFTIGEVGGTAGTMAECAYSGTVWHDWGTAGGLVLANGSIGAMSGRNIPMEVRGNVTVIAPDTKPFVFTTAANNTNACMRFTGKVMAETGKTLEIRAACTDYFIKMACDLTEYKGTMTLKNSGRLLCGTTTMPGTITMAAGTTFGTESDTSAFTVANLAINGNADWVVTAHATNELCGTVCVTGTYTQAGIVTVKPTAIPRAAAGAARVRVPVLTLGPNCTGSLDETKFACELPAALSHLDLEPAFELSADGRTLYLSCNPVVLLVRADKAENGSAEVNNDVYTSAMTNALAWSDGQVPHAGAHYLIGLGGAANNIRFNYVTDMTFECDTLTLGPNAHVYSLNKFTTVTNLYMRPGAQWTNNYYWQLYANDSLKNQNGIRGGRIYTYSSPGKLTSFGVYFYQRFHFESELVGDGDLKFVGSGSSANPHGFVYLDAPNTNFTGTMYVTIGNGTRNGEHWSPSFTHCETLFISDPRNLGAPLAAFNPKALHLDQMSVLHPTETLTLSDQTRGIYVGNMARFAVEAGKTFTVASPLAVHGELYKEGLGRLELGGALRFGADGTDTLPTAGSNLFTVASGSFRPLTHDCCDGLSIAFSNNTQMVLAAAPADVGLAQYGLYDVKTDTPFRLLGEGGRIPVTVTPPDGGDAGFYSVPICTVKASAAEAVKDALDLSFPLDGFVAKVRTVPVDAETTTLVATFAYGGTTIIFR